jgi:hypothetical protein
MPERSRLARRPLLRGALGAALIGLAPAALRRAAAEEKLKQSEAKYQPMPKDQQRCEICLQFLPPRSCKLVEGAISSRGWCQYFAARENAR